MNTARLLQFLLLAISAGCSTISTELSDAQRGTIAEEVERATREFEETERARDAEALLAYLAPDFYMYQDGLRFDRDAIEAQVRGTMPTLQRFETAFSDVEVRVLGRDSAVVSLTFRDRVSDASGTTTRQRGVTTFVWERRGEVWLITYADADHFPDTVPQDTVP